jgi:hypothetical protein
MWWDILFISDALFSVALATFAMCGAVLNFLSNLTPRKSSVSPGLILVPSTTTVTLSTQPADVENISCVFAAFTGCVISSVTLLKALVAPVYEVVESSS